MNTTTAGNAVRHGLSSLRHMPKGREAELGPIERELIDSRQPQTPEQLEIVQELAFAMWQKGEHERLMIWLDPNSASSILSNTGSCSASA